MDKPVPTFKYPYTSEHLEEANYCDMRIRVLTEERKRAQERHTDLIRSYYTGLTDAEFFAMKGEEKETFLRRLASDIYAYDEARKVADRICGYANFPKPEDAVLDADWFGWKSIDLPSGFNPTTTDGDSEYLSLTLYLNEDSDITSFAYSVDRLCEILDVHELSIMVYTGVTISDSVFYDKSKATAVAVSPYMFGKSHLFEPGHLATILELLRDNKHRTGA